MPEKRLIKKYANRRLYDVANSRHVTLAEVRAILEAGEAITVIDDKTGEEITRHILLQIITEREDKGETLLSTAFLERLIQFYGSGMQSVMAEHLESAMTVFLDNQQRLQDQFKALVTDTPLGSMAEMSMKNLKAWQQMQSDFVRKLLDGKEDDSDN